MGGTGMDGVGEMWVTTGSHSPPPRTHAQDADLKLAMILQAQEQAFLDLVTGSDRIM